MRRVAACLFLLLVLMGTLGTGAAWLWAWRAARAEGKARLKAAVPASVRVSVWLSAGELAAVRVDAHEVRIGGRMFDILRETPQGDRIHLELLPDHAEDALFAHLDELIAQLMGQGKARQMLKAGIGLGPCIVQVAVSQPQPTPQDSDVPCVAGGGQVLPGWLRIEAPPPQG